MKRPITTGGSERTPMEDQFGDPRKSSKPPPAASGNLCEVGSAGRLCFRESYIVKSVCPDHAPNGTVYWKQYTYDGLGRTVSATEADGTSTTSKASVLDALRLE